MAPRLLIDSGSGQFRVSKPGVDVRTADDFGLIFREYAAGLRPGLIGEVVVDGSAVFVMLPEPGTMPLLFLRDYLVFSDGSTRLMFRTNPNDAVDPTRTYLQIEPTSGRRTTRYYIFGNRQF